MINHNSKIYVAGHNGLVGSAILKKLKQKGYKNLIIADRKALNLTDQKIYDFTYYSKNFFSIVLIVHTVKYFLLFFYRYNARYVTLTC